VHSRGQEQAKTAYFQSGSTGSITDSTGLRIVKVSHQGEHGRRSLPVVLGRSPAWSWTVVYTRRRKLSGQCQSCIWSSPSAERKSAFLTETSCCSKKGKSSPYSITELRVPELIPVLGSQPAGDVSHKPDGRLPLLSQLPSQPLRGLQPISLLGEQRHDGCEQFA